MDAKALRRGLLNITAIHFLFFGRSCWAEPCWKPQQLANITGIGPTSEQYYIGIDNITMEECRDFCLNSCLCVAAFYNGNKSSCAYASEFSGSTVDSSLVAFLKIGSPIVKRGSGIVVLFVTALAMLVVGIGVLFLNVFLFCKPRYCGGRSCLEIVRRQQNPFPANSGNQIIKMVANNFIRSYSLKELEEATNDFSMVLGSGGFGNVYLGKLGNETEIAVKKMENWGQGDHEFCTEVSIIGMLYHRNLLQLRGYCADNKQRMLVYEYMPNGSLDAWLFQAEGGRLKSPPREPLPWATRMKIVVGIARGLAYLHQECRKPIVHLDIKPENVLLDNDFVPKLSDFGFSKVMNQDSMVYSNARGTPGYMAPEWLVESTVSSKSDVYSFGMVLLEIVGGRRNHDGAREGRDDVYYPCWAMKKLEEGRPGEIIDERIRDTEGGDSSVVAEAEILVKVGLSCIQKDVDLRPGTGRVVQMLEGLCPPPSLESLASIHLFPCPQKAKGRTLQSTLMSIDRDDFDISGNSKASSPQFFRIESPEFFRG